MTDPDETASPEAETPQPGERPNDPAAEPAEIHARTPDAASEPDPAGEGFKAVEALKSENASLKDRVLRTMAEMENLRRRTEKEVADAKAYGVSSFARDMVAVADNLHRALANLSVEARAELQGSAKSFAEGIELTERDFISRLARFGVKPIETTGARFDPNRHEALFELPDPSVPTGTVVQDVETGYTIGDRVLRPAKVGVSTGGPRSTDRG